MNSIPASPNLLQASHNNDHLGDAFRRCVLLFAAARIARRIAEQDETVERRFLSGSPRDIPSALLVTPHPLDMLDAESMARCEERANGWTSDDVSIDLAVRGLADLCESLGSAQSVDRESAVSRRKNAGRFYTPHDVAAFVVQETLAALVDDEPLSLRIADPAMGAGHFLLAALEFVCQHPSAASHPHFRRTAVERCLYGCEIDAAACEAARVVLWLASGLSCDCEALAGHLRCADSLSDPWPDAEFDAIIGNPPYLFGERIPKRLSQARDRFEMARGQFDVYWLFYEQARGEILREGGYHGFIVPDSILARDETACIREFITRENRLVGVFHVGSVFPDPKVSAAVVVWQKCAVARASSPACPSGVVRMSRPDGGSHVVAQASLATLPGCKWLVGLSEDDYDLLQRIYAVSDRLGDIATISRGEELGKKHLTREPGAGVPILAGSDVSSLERPVPSYFVDPSIIAKKRENYQSPKIVFVKTGSGIVAALDLDRLVTLQSVYNIHCQWRDPGFLCAVLNSTLLNWVAAVTFTDYKRVFPQFNQNTVASLPIPRNPSTEQPVKLSEAKHLIPGTEMLRFTQHDESSMCMDIVTSALCGEDVAPVAGYARALCRTSPPDFDTLEEILSFVVRANLTGPHAGRLDLAAMRAVIDAVVFAMYGIDPADPLFLSNPNPVNPV